MRALPVDLPPRPTQTGPPNVASPDEAAPVEGTKRGGYCCQDGVESPNLCWCPDGHSCDCMACECS